MSSSSNMSARESARVVGRMKRCLSDVVEVSTIPKETARRWLKAIEALEQRAVGAGEQVAEMRNQAKGWKDQAELEGQARRKKEAELAEQIERLAHRARFNQLAQRVNDEIEKERAGGESELGDLAVANGDSLRSALAGWSLDTDPLGQETVEVYAADLASVLRTLDRAALERAKLRELAFDQNELLDKTPFLDLIGADGQALDEEQTQKVAALVDKAARNIMRLVAMLPTEASPGVVVRMSSGDGVHGAVVAQVGKIEGELVAKAAEVVTESMRQGYWAFHDQMLERGVIMPEK